MRLGARSCWPLWLAVVPLALWALIRIFGLEGHTPIVSLLALTPYAAIAAFLLAGVCVALRNWAAAILAALAFVTLTAAVLPRAFGGGEEAPPGGVTFTVMSANLHLGQADAAALTSLSKISTPTFSSSRRCLERSRFASVGRVFAVCCPLLFFRCRLMASDVASTRAFPSTPLSLLGGNPRSMPPVSIRLSGGRRVRAIDVHPHPPYPGKKPLGPTPSRACPRPEPALLGFWSATSTRRSMTPSCATCSVAAIATRPP